MLREERKKERKKFGNVCCKLADSKRWRKRAANVCNCLRETGRIDTDIYIYIWNFIQLCPLWRVTSFSCISFPICDEVSPPSESQVYCVPFPPCLLWFAICRKKNSVERSARLPRRTFNLDDDLFFFFFFLEPNWTTLRDRLEPTANLLPPLRFANWARRVEESVGKGIHVTGIRGRSKRVSKEGEKRIGAICSARFGSWRGRICDSILLIDLNWNFNRWALLIQVSNKYIYIYCYDDVIDIEI